MSFLRRLLGGQEQKSAPSAAADQRQWFDLGRHGGDLEVTGTYFYRDTLAKRFGTRRGTPETIDVPAELRRDPGNRHDRNAVAVLLEGKLVGHLPRESSAGWSAFIGTCESQGFGVRTTAHVWVADQRINVYLALHHATERYLPPREQLAADQAKAAAIAAKEAAKEARGQERQAKRDAKAQVQEWRSAGLCANCGGVIESHEAGRRRIYCDSCTSDRKPGL